MKSKNFSASKLLESKIGYLDSKAGKTSKWTSSHDKPPRAGVQDRKASPSANESRQSSRNNNINFYESDLLELVDSMNK